MISSIPNKYHLINISNINQLFVQLNGLTDLFDPQMGTLTDIITAGQKGPGSNSSERVLHIP